MVRDRFQQRKSEVLAKIDKSSKGSWDGHILELCRKINESSSYYTTSSCSGRVLIMIDQEKKGKSLFLEVSHELIDINFFENLKMPLPLIKFKFEPAILHVACRDLESAQILMDIGQKAGWKKFGAISLGKNIVVEFTGSDKLEFPLIFNKKFLVDEEFLNLIVEKSNLNLKKGWAKLDKFKLLFN